MAIEADGIKKKWREIHANGRGSITPPETLYHYTDVHGLHGIVFSNNDSEIWLTDFRSTNDPTEGCHVKTLLEKSVAKNLPANAVAALGYFRNPHGGMLAEADEMLANFMWIANNLDRRFLTSFSESENELSQWVHYGAGGTGYCIGVSTESLLNQEYTAGDITFKLQLIPVEYRLHIQTKMINEFIADIAECYEKHAPILSTHSRALSTMYGEFDNLLRWFGSAYSLEFKNPHFSSEREWRLIVEVTRPDSINAIPARSRVKGMGITWYVPAKCAVQSIMAGPKVEYEQFRAACAPLMFTRLGKVRLSKSDIPLR